MPKLNVPRNYANTRKLTKAILDEIIDSVETLVNSTLLDSENINIDALYSNITETQADNVINAASTPAVDSLLSQVSSTQANNILTNSTFDTDTKTDTDVRSIGTSEQTTCTLTASNTGFYLVLASVSPASSAGAVTARIKVNSATVVTQVAGLSSTSIVYAGTLTTGVTVDLTLQRASSSASVDSKLVIVRIG